MSLSHILKGISGDFEAGRVWLSVGTGSMVVAPIVFQSWAMINGQPFSVVEFCTGYGIGIGAVLTPGLIGIGSKDKAGAMARQTMAATQAGDK